MTELNSYLKDKYMGIKVGMKVRTLREMMNGTTIIPQGSIGLVERRYGGLWLYFEHRCEHCHFGNRVWLRKVDPIAVEIAKEEQEIHF